MATMNSFPPDVPKSIDEAQDDAENLAGTVRAKASNLAEKATDTVRDGYQRAKDALTESDPMEMAREGGEALSPCVDQVFFVRDATWGGRLPGSKRLAAISGLCASRCPRGSAQTRDQWPTSWTSSEGCSMEALETATSASSASRRRTARC